MEVETSEVCMMKAEIRIMHLEDKSRGRSQGKQTVSRSWER
jgi:hypothetical protein